MSNAQQWFWFHCLFFAREQPTKISKVWTFVRTSPTAILHTPSISQTLPTKHLAKPRLTSQRSEFVHLNQLAADLSCAQDLEQLSRICANRVQYHHTVPSHVHHLLPPSTESTDLLANLARRGLVGLVSGVSTFKGSSNSLKECLHLLLPQSSKSSVVGASSQHSAHCAQSLACSFRELFRDTGESVAPKSDML